MKKQNQKSKKVSSQKQDSTSTKEKQALEAKAGSSEKRAAKQRPAKNLAKKAPTKRSEEGGAPLRMIRKAAQFLREAKLELKKVKWPTRKELLASTSVVILLVLLVSLYLGLVDFGLIKIIRFIVG
jgi:preprotein translocase subunit SecE